MGETIERIVELILNNFEEGEKSLDHPQHEGSNITLVLGNAAAGKSTLIHYIAKNDSQLISKSVTSLSTNKTISYIIEDADKKIGHRFNGQPATYTKLPELTFDPITKTFFCDSTGFEDNRDATYDITSSYFLKKISNRAKFLKFVFVINYSSVNPSYQDDADFKSLAKHATNMIKNIDKFNDGICLIATKVNEEKSDADVLDTMNTYLDELKKKLQYDDSQTETIKFIGALQTINGNNDAKLGFIRQPKMAGPISNIPEMQARKSSLLKLVHNIKFIENDNPADLDYIISKDSRNYVGVLVSKIHLQIRKNIDAIMDTTQKYYNEIAEQMVNKMNSFIDGIVSAKAHPSEVQILNDKLNSRKITLEQLTNEMENVTDVIELSKKIDKLVNLDTKNYNISEYTSTISAKGQFLKFLQSFYNSSSPIKWMESFKQTIMDQFLKSVTARLQSNAITVIDRLEKKIQLEMIKSANIIAAAFDPSQQSKPAFDGEQQLLRFNNTVMAMHPVCISQTVQKLTAMNSSCDNQFMLNIAKYDNYLEFMKKLIKTNDQSNNTSECAEGQDIVITYLRNATIWYCFLSQLHNGLSEYEVQNNPQKYNVLADQSFRNYVNQTVGSTDLNSFLQLCCGNLYRIMYGRIENVVLNNCKVNGLKNVIQSTFRNDLNVSCESNEMLVKGQFVKMSDIISNWCNGPIHSIKIFSMHKLFVDASLRRPGEKLQIFIIAPIWEVRGHQQIILDGKTGNAHSKSKAGDAGQNGLPGLPGGPGGNFVGFGESCIHCDNLYISVNGGKGGPGQDGGDGATGSHSNGSIEIQIPKSEDKIFLGNIVHQYWIQNPFPSFQKKQFQIDRTKREKIQFHRWLPMGVEVYLVYKDGGSGGNGGNGGIGGSGGCEGKVSIKFINQSHLNISQNTGEMGSHGLGGQGGKPGKDSELFVAKISKKYDFFDYHDLIRREEMQFYIESSDSVEIPGTVDNKIWYEIFDERRYSYILNQINITTFSGPDSKAIAGIDGIPGNNTASVVQPEETFLADTSHVINSYKNYCEEQMSGSIRELEMKNFLDQLDFMKDQSYDRRRRQTENNDGESYYRNERLTATRNSAGKIKSPLNYVINWFSSGIKQLKFWSFSTITNGNTVQLATTKLQNFANDYIQDDTGTSLNGNFNINELLLLADFIFKYFTKAKSYNNPIENSVDLLEIRACVLDIVEKFETLLNNKFFGPNLQLDFDPLTLMTNLEKEIIGGNLIEIPNILFQSILINDDYNGTWKLDKNSFSTQIRNKIEEMLEQRDDFLQEQFVTRHFSDYDLKMDTMNKISNFLDSPCNVNFIE